MYSSSTQNTKQSTRLVVSLFLALALVACLFIGESMAGKGNKGGGDDIILYNGNIVLRGSGGKGKGKGNGGNIVVANSQPNDQQVEMMPQMFDMWGGMGGMGRRR